MLIRTEGGGPAREALAIAAGVFIGCLPLYGFHLLICGAVGTIFGLNRLKMYLAANLSNPLMAPILVFSEIQAGAWLRRGSFHPVTLDAVKTTSPATFGADLVVGSVAVGAVLAAVAGWATYALVRRSTRQDEFADLVRRAADRYIDEGVVAWEFARGKLRGDPIYRACVCEGWLARCQPDVPGTLLDLGCGQGLTLALLAEARTAQREGRWPAAWPAPPSFDALVGIDNRPRVVDIAAAALGADAEVVVGDARTMSRGPMQAILLFDVLHLMPGADQETLLAALAVTLDPHGIMLIREADAGAGWRFTAVRLGNRLKSLVYGAWRQPFHFRTAAEWQTCLARHGLRAEVRQMSAGTPFGNVLLYVTRAQS